MEMQQDLTIVVGDRFREFAQNPSVQSISEYLAAARAGLALMQPVAFGQGLSQQAISDLCEVCPGEIISTERVWADQASTHKRAPKNIMISVPRALSDRRFEADLILDDSNEVMEDHQTGQHIQGIALLEAGRQLWTAVTERFLLAAEKDKRTRFVIDDVQSRFMNFVFPLPCRISLNIVEFASTDIEKAISVHVEFEQNGQLAATVDGRYRVIDERINARQELIAARRAIKDFIATDVASARNGQ
jgi:hypothetical protein